MRLFLLLAMVYPLSFCLAPAQEVKKKADDCYAYSVMIYPKKGSKYEAIITDPAFVKHFRAHESLDPKQLAPDARVTLHYMRGMNGSMGIRLKDVVSIVRLTALSRAEYQDVKNVIGKRIKKLNEQEKARMEKQKERRAREKKEREAAQAKARAAREEAKRKEALRDRFPLLKRFPPEKGWSRAMKEEIWRRKVVIKVFPKPEEQAFLDQFEAWEKELKAWNALQEKDKQVAEKEPAKK